MTSYLKLVTQTDRIPASAAARHATGTTSETCLHKNTNKYHIRTKLQVDQNFSPVEKTSLQQKFSFQTALIFNYVLKSPFPTRRSK